MNSLVVVLHAISVGGAQKVAVSTIHGLMKRGWKVQLVTLNHRGTVYFDADKLPWINLAGPGGITGWLGNVVNPIFFWMRHRRLQKTLKKINPDVVLSFVSTTNLATIFASRNCPWRVVISERSDPLRQRLRRPWEWLRNRFYHKADLVTANTLGAIEAMKTWNPETQ